MSNPALIGAVAQDAYLEDVGNVLAGLGTDPDRGLSEGEADTRHRYFGSNELATAPPVPAWRKLLAQISDVLTILLIVAALISGVLWFLEGTSAFPYEATAILAIVLLNGVMGYLQQSRAEQAVAALKKMSAAQATVVRGGTRRRIASAEVVPGDLLLIEEGDTIAADARVMESVSLQVSEAALTGESLPVEKVTAPNEGEAGIADRHNMVFGGTVATYGHGRAAVTAIGMATEMGRISGMLDATAEEPTPLQKQLDRVGRLLGAIVLVLAFVMVATIIMFEEIDGFSAFFDVLILGVALAVAAVPEGLPAVVTAVLSLGVKRMARRKAIVRHLAAVETLGSATVIATDKTGTLTRNEMTVTRVVTASGQIALSGTGYAPHGEAQAYGEVVSQDALREELARTLTAADRANNAVLLERDGRWSAQGDPTEAALIVAARKSGIEQKALDARFRRIGEVPFSSGRKLMSTIYTVGEGGQLRVFTKGAPDLLLSRCSHELVGDEARPLTEERRAAIRSANEELAGEALRTLAVAFRSLARDVPSEQGEWTDVEHDLVFLGLIGMIDPPREEAKEAVREARLAGIHVIMITGDHPRTASVIATQIGVSEDGRTVTGAELDKMSDEEFDSTVEQVSVFARVNPEHKLRLVKAFQRQGMTVAMTGDGVNDAPALKAADIGVSMGITGTDVAKEAADIVLADDNFASIVAAIEEGRAIFSNIRKFLRYLLSSNIGEVMTMFFGVVLADLIGLSGAGSGGLVLPLLATQILWINLVTDGFPALALGVDPADEGMMQIPPRPRGENVLTRKMWSGIVFVGVVTAAGTLFVLDASLPGGLIEGSGDLPYAQTMAFTTLTMFQLFNIFNARSDERSAFVGMFSNHWLWLAIASSLLLHAAVVYVPFLQEAFSTVPLGPSDWLLSAVVASSVLWLREASKVIVAWISPGSDRQAPRLNAA